MGWRRRATTSLVAMLAALGLLGVGAAPGGAGTVAEDPDVVREILFPVAGPHTYADTFGACRSGCTRGHEGTDIMAPQLTPLIAVRDSRVRAAKTTATPDGTEGNSIFLEDDEGWQYWYIHLNNDSPSTDDGANPPGWVLGPGIERGARVRAGQLVGFVGDSGNAEESGHHLHFEVHTPNGEVVNPYRSLLAAPHLSSPIATDLGPAGTTAVERGPVVDPDVAFVTALFQDFLGHRPSDVQLATQLDRLGEATTRRAMVNDFTGSTTWVRGLIDGYYRSTLGREADEGGRAFWATVIDNGATPAEVAAEFYASDEYHRRVGGSDDDWLRDLYAELLHRDADEEGLAFWLATLAAGTPRARVAFDFHQSLESRRTRVQDLYQRLLGRTPDREGLQHWAGVLVDGRDLALASFLASSDEYLVRSIAQFDEVSAEG